MNPVDNPNFKPTPSQKENHKQCRIDNYLDRLMSKIPGKIIDTVPNFVVDGETKYLSLSFNPKKYKTIELMHLCDLQYGHKAFKEDRFAEFRDWILDRPNCFVTLGGDLIDAATPLSVQSPYENLFEPSEQVLHFVHDLMAPLQARIIGMVGGNHDRRTRPTFGDAGSLIATLLKVKYSRGVQLIDIRYGFHDPFKISIWHGSGSARTKGAKAQMLHRFMGHADSQLYLVGHLHDVVLLFDWRQQRFDNSIKLVKVAGVMSSSFLDYWNTFSEVSGLSPSDTMMARTILEPNGHWEVTLR